MASVRIKVDRTNVAATISGRQTVLLAVPTIKVDVAYTVDEATGEIMIKSAQPVDLDMSAFGDVRNKRFRITLPYQGKPKQTAIGAWRFDLTNTKARLDFGVARSWDPSECGGQQGGTPKRPFAKPDYYITGRSVITFDYKQTNEIFEYTKGWQYKEDQVYESGPDKVDGQWSRPVLVQDYSVVCMLPPKNARYSHPERLSAPVLSVTLA